MKQVSKVLLVLALITSVQGTAFAAATAKTSSKPAITSTKTCIIKGNISADKKKEKIYHMPGCPNYNQTVITASAGERMFCTEAEAKNAGWRKSLNCPK
jgi:hypothetical protein